MDYTETLKQIEVIHESLLNGQRRQMVDQIDRYGLYDFWTDYKHWLLTVLTPEHAFEYFTDAAISYHRIKNR